jgi:hypothetical protein
MPPDALVEGHGYDPRCTPIDVLRRGPDRMHREVAHAMEHPEDYEETYDA